MADFQIGCFGKLPIYADFIRLHAESKEVRDLDQWFQEGIHFARAKVGRSWEDDFSKADRWRFVFHTGGDSFLTGVYLPGRDKAGRRYPFFLFLRGEKGRLGIPLWLAPIFFSEILTTFSEVARAGWQDKDLRAFLSFVGGLSFRPPSESASARELYRGYLQRQTMGAFWNRLFSDGDGDRRYHVIENLIKAVGPLRHQGAGRFGVGLKCPVGGGDLFDIAFWSDLVFRILKQDQIDPVLFWNEKGPAGGSSEGPFEGAAGSDKMMFFFNPPSPRAFLFQIRPDLKGESLYDPAGEATGEKRISQEQRGLLERDALSSAEFLDGIEKWV